MAEEFDIGGSGIDTQYERDYINYRPKLNTTPKVDGNGYGLYADTAGQNQNQSDDLQEIGESSIISVWEDVVGVVQEIDKVEQNLSEKLKDVSVPIPSIVKENIVEAANALGYSGVTDSIPFDLYKKTFEKPNSPSSALIQDVYEDYISDVNGTLNAELYADIAEIQNDWKDMRDFINKGLFGQIVSLDEVPTELSTEDAALQLVKEREQEMTTEYAELLKLQAVNQQIYLALSNSQYGSERYFQAVKDYDDTKRQIFNLEKKMFTKTEIVDLVGRKASDTNESVELISNSVDYDPFPDDKYELLYGLLKQFKTKEAMQTGLKKMQALLKLSIDRKKINTNATKANLRGIAGSESKRKINQTLINGVHLRNEVFAEVYDIVNNLDGIPSSTNFEVMLNHISDGVQQAEDMYQSHASDFYKIHSMDNELRTDKLGYLIDKDAARSVYKLIGSVLDYSRDVNQTWPSEDKLSAWLNDFMEQSKII